MKYYCKHCESEFIPAPHLEAYFWDGTVSYCPICLKDGEGIYAAVPDFETPEQYEARTGKPWPDNGLVWCLMDTVLIDWHLTQFRKTENGRLYINGHYVGIKAVICAQGPEAPPNDWRQ